MGSSPSRLNDLLHPHFSTESLFDNRNFVAEGQEQQVSQDEKEKIVGDLSDKIVEEGLGYEDATPYKLLASHMYQMYRLELRIGFRTIDGVLFDDNFIAKMNNATFECGTDKYAGYTFIADKNNDTMKYYTKNGAILVGSNTNEVTLENLENLGSLAFVAKKWVLFAIVRNATQDTHECTEKLELYTWTRSFDVNRKIPDTLVARQLNDLSIFLDREPNKASVLDRLNCKRTVAVAPNNDPLGENYWVAFNLGLNNDFEFDRKLLALAQVLEERSVKVDVYFQNEKPRQALVGSSFNAETHERLLSNNQIVPKFLSTEKRFEFALSAIVPVEGGMNVSDRITMPLPNHSKGVQLLGDYGGNGKQLHEYAKSILTDMDRIQEILESWDRRMMSINEDRANAALGEVPPN